MPILVETFGEFSKRHGGKCIRVDNRLLFPDGASVDDGDMLRQEPPTDPIALTNVRRQYVEAKLRQEVEDFNEFKAHCNQQAQFAAHNPACPPPPPDAADQLHRGKQRITALREQLAALDAELANMPQATTLRQHRKLDAERKRTLEEQLTAINAVIIE